MTRTGVCHGSEQGLTGCRGGPCHACHLYRLSPTSGKYPQRCVPGVSSRGPQDGSPSLSPALSSAQHPRPFQKVTRGWFSPNPQGPPPGSTSPPLAPWPPRLCPQAGARLAWRAASTSLVGCPAAPCGPLYSGSCNLEPSPPRLSVAAVAAPQALPTPSRAAFS